MISAGFAVVALVAAGCGSATTDTPAATSSAAPSGEFPKTIASGSDGGTVTIDAMPRTIVSLSPTATETLFAVGAGEQVAAVDDQSDYPADAPKTGLSAFTPSLEAIVAYDPDLVITSTDLGIVTSTLAEAGVPTLLLPAATSLDDAYSQIEQVAGATGHDAEGDAVVAQMRDRIDAAVASVPTREEQLTYFHELDDTLYTVTSQSFVGQIYGLFGLQSIADGSDAGDYPQLSAETVITADPDMIFLADAQCCGVTAESVAARPGWGSMPAVRDDRIFPMDEDLSSRWGPRIADQVEAVAAVVQQIPA
ncbi:ABC transporter substrate-binding protein [Rhodococcus sp. 06-235-1A]|uniref:ABC transporter substrate-binding protein n=1 Tax=Rhodococcus sp. 06-235-1A TaxID=2022508 RepID=UPI000B9BF5ED|nr:ABC transporter substrate-binding protein [Rhodococcus sp. 06-235-1A]OZD02455.1 ABC transporter substrate-binding protein [Rhodococcus sp. 06-235-1A]